MNRKKVHILEHHVLWPNIITGIGFIGMISFVYGLVVLHFWLVILGGGVVMIANSGMQTGLSGSLKT